MNFKTKKSNLRISGQKGVLDFSCCEDENPTTAISNFFSKRREILPKTKENVEQSYYLRSGRGREESIEKLKNSKNPKNPKNPKNSKNSKNSKNPKISKNPKNSKNPKISENPVKNKKSPTPKKPKLFIPLDLLDHHHHNQEQEQNSDLNIISSSKTAGKEKKLQLPNNNIDFKEKNSSAMRGSTQINSLIRSGRSYLSNEISSAGVERNKSKRKKEDVKNGKLLYFENGVEFSEIDENDDF